MENQSAYAAWKSSNLSPPQSASSSPISTLQRGPRKPLSAAELDEHLPITLEFMIECQAEKAARQALISHKMPVKVFLTTESPSQAKEDAEREVAEAELLRAKRIADEAAAEEAAQMRRFAAATNEGTN